MNNIQIIHENIFNELKTLLSLLRELAHKLSYSLPQIPYRHEQFDSIKNETVYLTRIYDAMYTTKEFNYIDKTTQLHNNINIIHNRITSLIDNIDNTSIAILEPV